jgi:hypothetical protein
VRGAGDEEILSRREKSSGSASGRLMMVCGEGWGLRGEVEMTRFGDVDGDGIGDFSCGRGMIWGGGRSALSRGRVALQEIGSER